MTRLPIVPLERLAQRGGGFVAPARRFVHLGQIAQRVALQAQRVRQRGGATSSNGSGLTAN